MAKGSKNPETELSPEETEDLRNQSESEDELDPKTEIEDELDESDDQEIDETQRQEEQRQEAEAQKRGQKQQQKTVPHQAFHEERETRKARERELGESRERYARLEGRMQQILDSLKRDDQQEEQIPDRETQPFDYMAYQDRRIAALEERQNGQTRQSQQQTEIDNALNYGNHLASQFRDEVGAEQYDAAFQFMWNLRGGELEDMGYPPHTVRAMLEREVQSGILTALQNKVNPGEMLWKMAKRRGFEPKQPEKKQEMIEEGQRRSMSLGKGAQRKIATPGSVEDINAMSDDDFEKWVAKYGNKGLRRAFLGDTR